MGLLQYPWAWRRTGYTTWSGPPMEYPVWPVHELLADSARRYPKRTALVFYGRNISYRALFDEAKRVASGLVRLGLRKGDRVAITLPNCPQIVSSYYGVLWADGTVVMVSPLLAAPEMRRQLQDSEARYLITLDSLYSKAAQATADGQTAVEKLIIASLHDLLPFPLDRLARLMGRHKGGAVRVPQGESAMRFGDLVSGPPLETPAVIDPAVDIAVLQYTGGSTGTLKGAMLTHSNVLTNCLQVDSRFPGPRDVQLTLLGVLPFFHIFGMTGVMNFGVSIGARIVLVPRFTVAEVLKLIRKYRVDIMAGVPSMFSAINSYPNVEQNDLTSLRWCLSGGAPLRVDVKEAFEKHISGVLAEGYGLTEASPVTHCNPLNGLNKAGSIGVPVPETHCRIVHPRTRASLPPGEAGELVVKGPQVMAGYWKQPKETAQTLKDGWLHTGDIARVDEDGYFYIVDRKKELIIVSGFNVYPREVEDVLCEHADVKEAAVIGVADSQRGEAVKAFVVRKPGSSVSARDLIAWCRERLAPYKAPRRVEFVTGLPKARRGKGSRRILADRERAASEGKAATAA